MNIPKEALALIGAASNDPARYQLTGVRFVENGCLEAVATDGKQLTRLRWNEPVEGSEAVTIDIDSLKTVKKTMGKEDSHFSLESGEHGAERRIELREATVTTGVIQGVYPNYESVLVDGGFDRTYHIDPFILRDQMNVLIGALGLTKKKNACYLTMRFGPKKGCPMRFEGTDKSKYLSVTGLVMPIVLNKKKKK